MERQRLVVTKRASIWGMVYIIGGTEEDGEALPVEQADELIARFDHEQHLLAGSAQSIARSTQIPSNRAA
jgi:hypothetical protein